MSKLVRWARAVSAPPVRSEYYPRAVFALHAGRVAMTVAAAFLSVTLPATQAKRLVALLATLIVPYVLICVFWLGKRDRLWARVALLAGDVGLATGICFAVPAIRPMAPFAYFLIAVWNTLTAEPLVAIASVLLSTVAAAVLHPPGYGPFVGGMFFVALGATVLLTSVLSSERARMLTAVSEQQAQFVAMASHELRTPLTAMLGSLLTLDRQWDSLSETARRSLFQMMLRQTKRMTRLSEDLLTSTRGARPDPESVPVAMLVHDVLRELDCVGVTVDVPDDLFALADPDHLRRIVVNYVANALHHGRAPIFVRAFGRGAGLQFEVWDAGDGVPEESVSKMWDRFAQGSLKSKGTGLGLYITKMLVEANGGEVFYRRSRGRTCFGARLNAIRAIAVPSPKVNEGAGLRS